LGRNFGKQMGWHYKYNSHLGQIRSLAKWNNSTVLLLGYTTIYSIFLFVL
jgi:hypothetical protein